MCFSPGFQMLIFGKKVAHPHGALWNPLGIDECLAQCVNHGEQGLAARTEEEEADPMDATFLSCQGSSQLLVLVDVFLGDYGRSGC
jgi:hypothetical protein